MRILGGCHCGNLAYECELPGERPSVRACQCSFCRAHCAATASDPRGTLVFRVADERALSRYQFGELRLAEMLVCAKCGVYLGAVMPTGSGLRGTANLRAARNLALPEVVEK